MWTKGTRAQRVKPGRLLVIAAVAVLAVACMHVGPGQGTAVKSPGPSTEFRTPSPTPTPLSSPSRSTSQSPSPSKPRSPAPPPIPSPKPTPRAPLPLITRVSPNRAPADSSYSQTVNVYGSHFKGLVKVLFGKYSVASASALISDSQLKLTAHFPGPPAGWVDVRVVTAAGASPITSADRFLWIMAPQITSIVPNHAPYSGGKVVKVYGRYFSNATGVGFTCNGCSTIVAGAKFTVVSDTEIDATVPNMGGPGTGDIEISNPGGLSAQNSASTFTYF